jgi:hypothetical protein
MRKRLATLSFLLVLLVPALAMSQASPVLVLSTRIALANVDGRMDHLSVDVKGQRLFATAFNNHTLEVVDLKSGRQAHTIRDLNNPQGAYYDPATNRLFVARGGDGTVNIFDGTTYKLLQTIKLSSDADNVRYDARSKRVLVGYGGEKFLGGKVTRGQGDGALAILDLTGKVGEIAMDAHPESFQLEKAGTRVFVNVPDHQEVEVADLVKGTVVAHWPVTCTDNFPMTLDETHHRLFIGCRTPASVLVFDTGSGKTVASLESVTSDDIFYDASKGRLYVLGQGVMDVFQQNDADHYAKIANYPTGPGAWTGLFVPDWGKLFVAARHQDQQSAEILVYETK